MSKKIIKTICILLLGSLLLMGCGSTDNSTVPTAEPESESDPSQDETDEPETTEDAEESEDDSDSSTFANKLDNLISDKYQDMDDYYSDYKEEGGAIAYITAVSEIDDTNYNTAVYDGVKTYATGAGVSYSYYMPSKDEPAEYEAAVMKAVDTGAILIVTSGSHFDTIVGNLQDKYPEISFLMVDGTPKDDAGEELPISSNVHCISFKEQEAGYLAGYMTAIDGYTRFGFIGGEDIPAIERYEFGFIQGINDASLSMGNSALIDINCWYCGGFLPNDTIYDTATDWYTNDDTQIIFSCGGGIYESILSAAEACDKKIIGVDIDQSAISPRILTCAMKGVDRAVVIALDDFFAFNGWSQDTAGVLTEYGINERCSSLPTDEWRFENVTREDYDSLHGLIKSGLITISETADILDEIKISVDIYSNNEE